MKNKRALFDKDIENYINSLKYQSLSKISVIIIVSNLLIFLLINNFIFLRNLNVFNNELELKTSIKVNLIFALLLNCYFLVLLIKSYYQMQLLINKPYKIKKLTDYIKSKYNKLKDSQIRMSEGLEKLKSDTNDLSEIVEVQLAKNKKYLRRLEKIDQDLDYYQKQLNLVTDYAKFSKFLYFMLPLLTVLASIIYIIWELRSLSQSS